MAPVHHERVETIRSEASLPALPLIRNGRDFGEFIRNTAALNSLDDEAKVLTVLRGVEKYPRLLNDINLTQVFQALTKFNSNSVAARILGEPSNESHVDILLDSVRIRLESGPAKIYLLASALRAMSVLPLADNSLLDVIEDAILNNKVDYRKREGEDIDIHAISEAVIAFSMLDVSDDRVLHNLFRLLESRKQLISNKDLDRLKAMLSDPSTVEGLIPHLEKCLSMLGKDLRTSIGTPPSSSTTAKKVFEAGMETLTNPELVVQLKYHSETNPEKIQTKALRQIYLRLEADVKGLSVEEGLSVIKAMAQFQVVSDRFLRALVRSVAPDVQAWKFGGEGLATLTYSLGLLNYKDQVVSRNLGETAGRYVHLLSNEQYAEVLIGLLAVSPDTAKSFSSKTRSISSRTNLTVDDRTWINLAGLSLGLLKWSELNDKDRELLQLFNQCEIRPTFEQDLTSSLIVTQRKCYPEVEVEIDRFQQCVKPSALLKHGRNSLAIFCLAERNGLIVSYSDTRLSGLQVIWNRILFEQGFTALTISEADWKLRTTEQREQLVRALLEWVQSGALPEGVENSSSR